MNHLAEAASEDPRLAILDLGCGDAKNFVRFLDAFPEARYYGIEPSAPAAAAARKLLPADRATIITGPAYDIERHTPPACNVVVSFSTFEHVYRRQEYMRSAFAALKPGGICLMNYDDGHFFGPNSSEPVKNVVGRVLALGGNEQYFQRFVPEQEFRDLASSVGFSILDAKTMNCYALKDAYKAIAPKHRGEFMERWLAMELSINEMGLAWDDAMARTWGTRQFVLSRPHRLP